MKGDVLPICIASDSFDLRGMIAVRGLDEIHLIRFDINHGALANQGDGDDHAGPAGLFD